MLKKCGFSLWCLGLALFMAGAAAAADESKPGFDRVEFQVSVQRTLPNDEMDATLVSEQQGSSAKEVADKVNRDMQWALELIHAHKNIRGRTTGYQTYPIYDQSVISSWQVTEELHLRSGAIAELTALLGQLQQRLHVRDIKFSPASAARDKVENELIEKAMEAFKHRANIIRQHMGNREYRIVKLHIDTGGERPPVVYRSLAMEAKAAPHAPALQPGTSKVTVTVSGTIQFY